MKNYTEHTDLLTLLETSDLSALQDVRYAPTSFDPKDPGATAFPFSDNSWSSAEESLRLFESRIVMVRLPLFWQLHPRLHAACRRVSAVMYSNALNNAPLGLAAIRHIHVDTIVSDAKNAEMFAHDMLDAGITRATSWLVIHSPTEDWGLPEVLKQHRNRAQEIHLFPGIVLLQQCKQLIESASGVFHANEDFTWEMEKSGTYITLDGPVPLKRYRLPFTLEERGICPCGKSIYARAA